eukprot:6192683-Lingulodinium_polyedra.AAC.1
MPARARIRAGRRAARTSRRGVARVSPTDPTSVTPRRQPEATPRSRKFRGTCRQTTSPPARAFGRCSPRALARSRGAPPRLGVL